MTTVTKTAPVLIEQEEEEQRKKMKARFSLQADDSASKADGADGGGASPSAKSAESSPPTVQLSSDASAPQCGIDGGNDSGAQGGSRLQSMTQDSLLKVPAIENGSGNGGNNSGDDTGKLSSQTSGPSRQELDNNLRQGGARQRGEEEPGQSGGQRSTLKPEAGFAAEVKPLPRINVGPLPHIELPSIGGGITVDQGDIFGRNFDAATGVKLHVEGGADDRGLASDMMLNNQRATPARSSLASRYDPSIFLRAEADHQREDDRRRHIVLASVATDRAEGRSGGTTTSDRLGSPPRQEARPALAPDAVMNGSSVTLDKYDNSENGLHLHTVEDRDILADEGKTGVSGSNSLLDAEDEDFMESLLLDE